MRWLSRLAGSAAVVSSLACTGVFDPVRVRDAGCHCSIERPWNWSRMELLDDREHLGLGAVVAEQYLAASFISKDSQNHVSSPIVLLDSFTADDIDLPLTLAEPVTIDGQPAALREVAVGGDPPVDMLMAMVPYPDGHVWLMGWALQGDEEGLEVVRTAMQSLRRTEAPWSLPEGLALAPALSTPIDAARADLVGGVATDHEPPELVPDGLEAVAVPTDVGALPAWASPVADAPRPGLLYLAGGFDGHDAATAADLDDARQAGMAVMLPHVRGQAGIGPHELFGREVDDARAALELLRSRPDVDPDRVYVMGYGTGSLLALLLAESTDGIRAVVTLEGPTDMGLVRRDFERLYGTDAYPADPHQDDLRSATRFAGQLRAPVWAMHGEFSDDALHGELMAAAAHRVQAPYRWHVIPRATSDWAVHALPAVAQGMVADDGPEADLGLDAATLHSIAATAWEARAPELVATTRLRARALWHGHVYSDPQRVVQAVSDLRGEIDGRLPTELAKQVTREPVAAMTTSRAALERASDQLAQAGIVLALGYDHDTMATYLAESSHPGGCAYVDAAGFVAATEGTPLWLSYADRVPDRDDEQTLQVGRQVVLALQAAGLEVRWDEDPDQAIGVVGTWWPEADPEEASDP